MSDLVDLVEPLKRALSAPGEFTLNFPESTDPILTGVLADSVAESQLDGFLVDYELDSTASTVLPDLVPGQQALVVLYGMARVTAARVSNLKNHTRYKAGNVEAEVEQSASILVELLKEINSRKKQLLADVKAGNVAHGFAMVDMYVAKSIDFNSPEVAYVYPVWTSNDTGTP